MSDNRLENILALYSVPSVGSYKTRQLISIFGTAERALSASAGQLQKVPGIGKKIAAKLKNQVDEKFIKRQLAAVEKGQQNIVSFWDKDYPTSLKNIYDPPVLLFYSGDLSLTKKQSLAIVGTRDMTDHGRRSLDLLIKPLKGWDITIVSGMARGIDSHTHHLCLKLGISTIAVLGHGMDKIYPPENVSIWKQMVEYNLIVTEYPLGTRFDPKNFPRRNRIISGLSQGLMVVEAGEKSGALISADFATEQNRDVFAVPAAIHLKQSTGPNKLIADGAIPVYNVDVLKNWIGDKNPPPESEEEMANDLPELNEKSEKIYKSINYEPRHVDQIALNNSISLAETLCVLLELELAGLIRQMPGKMFVLSQ